MGSRGLVAILLMLGGVVGAYVFYAQDFETIESITVQAPAGGLDRGPLESFVVDDVIVSCTSDGRHGYRSRTGGPLFFNGSGPTYPDARPICEAARSERLPASALIAVAGLLAGVLVLATGRARANQKAAADIEALAAAAAARPGTGLDPRT